MNTPRRGLIIDVDLEPIKGLETASYANDYAHHKKNRQDNR